VLEPIALQAKGKRILDLTPKQEWQTSTSIWTLSTRLTHKTKQCLFTIDFSSRVRLGIFLSQPVTVKCEVGHGVNRTTKTSP